MAERPTGAIVVQGEIATPAAKAQVLRYDFFAPPNSILPKQDTYRLDFSLSARHPSTRARFTENWRPHRFERVGEIFLQPAGMELSARSDEDSSVTSLVFWLQPESLLPLFDEFPPFTDQHMIECLDIRSNRLRSLLLQVADEIRTPGFCSDILVDSLTRQIAVELFRHGHTIAQPTGRGGLAAWQLRMIEDRLIELTTSPTLSELAALCRISVRHLTRAFRTSRNCSLGEYIVQRRLDHARRLLETDTPITDIAHTLGFASPTNFSYAFRRALGMTPSQFRRDIARPSARSSKSWGAH